MELSPSPSRRGRLTAVQTGAGRICCHPSLPRRPTRSIRCALLAARFCVTSSTCPLSRLRLHRAGESRPMPIISRRCSRPAASAATRPSRPTDWRHRCGRHGAAARRELRQARLRMSPPDFRPRTQSLRGDGGQVEQEGLGSWRPFRQTRLHAAYLAAHPRRRGPTPRADGHLQPDGFIAACRSLIKPDLTPQLGATAIPRAWCAANSTPRRRLRVPAASRVDFRRVYVELPTCGHCPPLEHPRRSRGDRGFSRLTGTRRPTACG